MSLIRFRKRIQIDANNNLYARDPLNPDNFIIVGNVNEYDPGLQDGPGTALVNTIRYRKAVRIDEYDDLFIIDPVNPTQFLNVGNVFGIYY